MNNEVSQMLTKLRIENDQLKAETRRLRKKVRPGRHEGIINRAYDNARLILHLRSAGIEVSRRRMAETGQISEWNYGWALGLLRAARLEDAYPEGLEHLNICLGRLYKTKTRLIEMESEDAMIELRARAGKRYIWNVYY